MEAQPESAFAKSLYRQYCARGGLSKGQLEGLQNKAAKVKSISPGKIATLQAIILKKHTKFRSEKPVVAAPAPRDETIGQDIAAILEKFPQHKRVLFLKSSYEKAGLLSPADTSEIKKFKAILLK